MMGRFFSSVSALRARGALLGALLALAALAVACGGTEFAFSSNLEGGEYDIYSSTANGGNLNNLGDTEREDAAEQMLAAPVFDDFAPDWSPDGTKIAFHRLLEVGGASEIFVMDANGENVTQLTDNGVRNANPAWSPDGTRIAFQSNLDGDDDIYVMDAGGLGARKITTNFVLDQYPSWSPDGTQLVYTSNATEDERHHVFVVSADGTGARQVTDAAAHHLYPDWSPDGTRIAFTSLRDGQWQIYTTDVNGANTTQVTMSEGEKRSPSWSPDGGEIVFSGFTGNFDLFVVNADGSNLRQLSDAGFNIIEPDWRPSE